MRGKITYVFGRSGYTFLTAHPPFAFLFASRILSRFGESLLSIVIPWLVLRLSGSTLQLGLALALQVLPALVLAPIIGVYVDRWPKKTMLVLCDMSRSALGIGIGLLWLLGALRLWDLYVVLVVNSVVTTIIILASRIILPRMLEKTDITRANSLLGFGRAAFDLLDKIAGGVLLTWAGPFYTFLVDGAFFGGATLFWLLIRATGAVRETPSIRAPSVIRSFLDGLKVLRHHMSAILSIAQMVVLNIGIAFLVLALPVLSERTFHSGVFGYGLLDGAMALGAMCASLVTSYLADRFNQTKLSEISLILFGVTMVGLGVVRSLPWGILVMTLVGITTLPVLIYTSSVIQKSVPPENLGRVFSAQHTALRVIPVVVFLSAGAILETLGASSLLICAGGITIIGAVVLLQISKRTTLVTSSSV